MGYLESLRENAKFLDLTAQAANIASTLVVNPKKNGLHEIRGTITVTQAATTSSTLPSVSVSFTDADSGQAQSIQAVASNGGNALTTTFSFDLIVNAAVGVPINISTSSYASSGATPMQYALHVHGAGVL